MITAKSILQKYHVPAPLSFHLSKGYNSKIEASAAQDAWHLECATRSVRGHRSTSGEAATLSTRAIDLHLLISDGLLPEEQPSRAQRRAVQHVLLIAVAAAILAGRSVIGHPYWTVCCFHIPNDDSYVKADNTTVASKVAEYSRATVLNGNQLVRVGQVIAGIDDRDLTTALDQARAGEQAAESSSSNVDARLAAQRLAIHLTDAAVLASDASLGLAHRAQLRREKMAATGYGSSAHADDITDACRKALGLERLRAGTMAAGLPVEDAKRLAVASGTADRLLQLGT